LRSDQAGDNCYYLGLIFTLISLAYAIFTFNPGDTATTIVQGFGIALFTTILGLALRVFFNQARVDLVETEDSVRIELTEAAARLKTQLSQIVIQMNDFGHQTVQSLAELRDAIATELTGATENMRKASAAALETINTEATETASRLRKLATATDKATASLEKQSESVSAIEESSRGMAASVGAISELATATQNSLIGLSGHVDQLKGLQDALQGSNRTLTESVTGLHATLQSFEASAAQLDQRLATRLADFKMAPVDGFTDAAGTIAAAVERVRGELDKVVDLQGQAAGRLAEQSNSALATATRHNGELEAELAKSRELVRQVHDAMVELTGYLVKRVETQSP
jgi:methyl-accepting chemotaxis protein